MQTRVNVTRARQQVDKGRFSTSDSDAGWGAVFDSYCSLIQNGAEYSNSRHSYSMYSKRMPRIIQIDDLV